MSADPTKFRLITRSDFDGLVCAVLLKHLNLIDDIKFVCGSSNEFCFEHGRLQKFIPS